MFVFTEPWTAGMKRKAETRMRHVALCYKHRRLSYDLYPPPPTALVASALICCEPLSTAAVGVPLALDRGI